MFADRNDAGTQLAEELLEREIDADIVLAIPRGGLPLGRKVADALHVPLDIVVARKISAPRNEELALGAVASDGSVYLDEDMVQRSGATDDYLEEQQEIEAENAREKRDRYRDGDTGPDLEGKTVVIVDDGVATGSTAIACLRQVREAGAARVILAVPVGPPDTIDDLEDEADEVICLEQPELFMAVGQFYDRFDQVSDEEAMEYLDR
ncbi:MAG: phosphoribosyltransferase family protein [Candidatus Nanohaloarchaea archaeon]|nr:phosphoribosyltransferase family protein [Candidatus Nanohaloarchaea archaeon]